MVGRLLPAGLLALAFAGCSFDPRGANSLDPADGDDDGTDVPTDDDPAFIDAAPSLPAPDAGFGTPVDGPIQVWLSEPSAKKWLRRQADLPPSTASATSEIVVDDGLVYQPIEGFGASLTESAAFVLSTQLAAPQRTAALRKLFDPELGLGLRVLRQPIGATDFSLGDFTYDDTPPDLGDFSIARDRSYVVPVLREIQAIRPDLLLFASPWSAPAWMKDSGSLIGGRLQPAHYADYADYLVRFLDAYAAEGLTIDALTVQNEPHFEPPGYPGMYMEAAEQADFLAGHLLPALALRVDAPAVYAWDHNWDEWDYPVQVLSDARLAGRLAGAAFHCYDGTVEAQSAFHAAVPAAALWLTECSGGAWVGDEAANFDRDVDELVIAALRNWSRGVIKWNLALDEARGPQNGGCSNCDATLRVVRGSQEFSVNGEAYALAHAARFVRAGAHRVESSGGAGLSHVAFANRDGSRVLLVHNPGQAAVLFAVRAGSTGFGYTLPARATATFVWGGPSGLVARAGWKASASSSDGLDVPAAAIDGDPATRWTTGKKMTGDEWFELDLGAIRPVRAVVFDSGASGDYARGYELSTSTDGESWQVGVAAGQGDADLFAARFPAQPVRYLRVRQTGQGANWWSIHELELLE